MQTPFVGEGRKRMVERLLRSFDEVSSTSVPAWIDLSAPSGWGKTRILQEFFTTLSTQRQDDPPYWPTSLWQSAEVTGDTVLSDRKILRPTFAHTAESLPSYMWWAIACSRSRGHQTTALANDLRQLVAHSSYLDDALTARKGRTVRLLASQRQRGKEFAEIGAEEAATLILENVLSSAIPGLGLARPIAQAVRSSIDEKRQRQRRRESTDLIVEDSDELVLGALSLIQRLSSPGNLPIVIVVEDLHLADRELAALLEASLALDSANILIVTTSWPGFIEDNSHLSSAFATARDLGRFTQLSPGGSDDTQTDLTPLHPDELASIINSVFPGTPDNIIEHLISIVESPLALMLILDLPRFTRFRGSPLAVPIEDLPSESSAIEDIVREIWNEMPTDTQLEIGIAALSTPLASPEVATTSIPKTGNALGHLDEWDIDLIVDSISSLQAAFPTLRDPGRTADQYAWSTALSSSLRKFRDPLYFNVACSRVDDHLLASERTTYRHSLALAAEQRWHSALPAPEREGLANLLVGLSLGEISINKRVLAEAALLLLHSLELEPSAWSDAIAFSDVVLRGINDPIASAPLAIWRSRLASNLGDYGGARRSLREIVRVLENGNEPTLLAEAKHHLAAVSAQAGKLTEAIELAEAALAMRQQEFGSSSEQTLRTMMNLAWFTALSGEHTAAERQLRDICEKAEQALGKSHPIYIASVVAWSAATALAHGRSAAIPRLEELRRDAVSTIGQESPIALIVEYNLLVAQAQSMALTDAEAALEGLRQRALLTFGNCHPFLDQLEEGFEQSTDDWEFFVQLMGNRSSQ